MPGGEIGITRGSGPRISGSSPDPAAQIAEPQYALVLGLSYFWLFCISECVPFSLLVVQTDRKLSTDTAKCCTAERLAITTKSASKRITV